MPKKRVISGLMEYMQAVQSGEEFEWRQNSPNYVQGMGIGATKDATRWAYIGYCIERETERERIFNSLVGPKPKKFGRPKTYSPLGSLQNRRAFALWLIVKNFNEAIPDMLTTRHLIIIARNHPEYIEYASLRSLFPDNEDLEQSISRGKTALSIDRNWASDVCEKLDLTLSQITKA